MRRGDRSTIDMEALANGEDGVDMTVSGVTPASLELVDVFLVMGVSIWFVL